MNTKTTIATNRLFQGLHENELAAIEAIVIEKQYGRGETIFLKGMMAMVFIS